jgi:hypothetical protein
VSSGAAGDFPGLNPLSTSVPQRRKRRECRSCALRYEIMSKLSFVLSKNCNTLFRESQGNKTILSTKKWSALSSSLNEVENVTRMGRHAMPSHAFHYRLFLVLVANKD